MAPVAAENENESRRRSRGEKEERAKWKARRSSRRQTRWERRESGMGQQVMFGCGWMYRDGGMDSYMW